MKSLKPAADGTLRSIDARLDEELGHIRKRMEAEQIGPTELQRLVGRAKSSVWYGWQNGTRATEHGPGFLDLETFAGAVRLRVRIIDENTDVQPDGTVAISDGGGGTVRDARNLFEAFLSLPTTELEKARLLFEGYLRAKPPSTNPPVPGELEGQ